MKIIVVGAGYVGLSNAILLAKENKVVLIDIDKKKISLLKNRKSPIKDSLIERYLLKGKLSLTFDHDLYTNLKTTQVIVIAVPTNFCYKIKEFDTTSIEKILENLNKKKYTDLVVIRSTVPVGFTSRMQKRYPKIDIAFYPEFLREGQALKDNLYPSRIICGSKSKKSKKFLELLKKLAAKKNIQTQVTSSSEAESIKLFSNMFLAMRVSFFNEVDSFSISKNLDVKEIIKGVSLDPRIGNFYNNPSFGYGGYCLPKDTKQLKKDFNEIPQKLVHGTIQSNTLRKNFILKEILKTKVKNIGIYRLSMKVGSDNFKGSSVIDILKGLKKYNKCVIIFEPNLSTKTFMGCKVFNDLRKFKKQSRLIIANRIDKDIEDCRDLIFSRDIFQEN